MSKINIPEFIKSHGIIMSKSFLSDVKVRYLSPDDSKWLVYDNSGTIFYTGTSFNKALEALVINE